MTAKELRRLLKAADLSQRAAAKLLAIDERTMRRYVGGDSKIPRAVEYALRWIIHESPG